MKKLNQIMKSSTAIIIFSMLSSCSIDSVLVSIKVNSFVLVFFITILILALEYNPEKQNNRFE